MVRSLRALGGLAAACALLALPACTSSSTSTSTSSKPATDSTISVLTYGVNAIAPTLDVAHNYNAPDMAIMGLVTQPLEIANMDGTFTPVLAEQVSQPDNVTLVYDLRDDVTFSDGKPLTADDVVWTIDHLREPNTHTASELADFKTVTATGDHQVTITLKRPNNGIRGAFAIISFIQEKAYGEASDDELGTAEAPPIGTGPYVVESFDTDGIDLARNDTFEGEPTAPDTIEVRLVADDTAAQLAMRSGDIDVYPLIDVKTSTTWGSVSGASLYSTPTMYLDYVTMNTSMKPFDDVHVRRAVAYATDVEGLLKANYGTEANPPVAMVPTQIINKMAPDEQAAADLNVPFEEISFDLEMAKQELAQSDYPDGFKAEYQYYSPTGKIVGLSLAENLGQIGIELELKSVRLNEFLGNLFVDKVPDIGFFSISAIVPDPASWYIYLVGPGNPYNSARYSTPATDAALKVIDEGSDESARWDAMESISDALATDMPYVGLAQPNFVVAGADGVTFTESPDFMEISTGNWIYSLKSTE
jgi:peptide/nickel transport system substrate-binding protein